MRTIQSPGVEIREFNLSDVAPAIVGTTFFVQGFADKGEEYNPLEIATMSDFETNFGQPTNEAERYFYYSANEIIRTGGSLIAAKLPYNNTISKNYKYIGLAFDTGNSMLSSGIGELTGMATEANSATYFTTYSNISYDGPYNIPVSGYNAIDAGGAFTNLPTNNSFDFVLVNENKARITGPNENEGIFVTLVDPVDAMNVQRMLPSPSDDDVMEVISGLTLNSTALDSTEFGMPLTGEFYKTSFSEDANETIPNS